MTPTKWAIKRKRLKLRGADPKLLDSSVEDAKEGARFLKAAREAAKGVRWWDFEGRGQISGVKFYAGGLLRSARAKKEKALAGVKQPKPSTHKSDLTIARNVAAKEARDAAANKKRLLGLFKKRKRKQRRGK